MTTKTFEIPVQSSRTIEVTFPFYAKRQQGSDDYSYYCFDENGYYIRLHEKQGVFTVIKSRMDMNDPDDGRDFIETFLLSEQPALKTVFAMLAQKIKFSIEALTGHEV